MYKLSIFLRSVSPLLEEGLSIDVLLELDAINVGFRKYPDKVKPYDE